MRTALVLSLVALLLSACAKGNRYDYHTVLPALAASTPHEVAVAVQDRRPYILDGDKTASFVGLQRGGWHIPFDVTTLSGRYLAEDFTIAVVNGLERKGIMAKILAISSGTDPSEVVEALAGSGAQRWLLITLYQWKSDTFVDIAMFYDLSAEVFDQRGKRLALYRLDRREDIDGAFWNAPRAARENVPLAYRRILEQLLNNAEIVGALK